MENIAIVSHYSAILSIFILNVINSIKGVFFI
jgi:hypothetical protein